MKTVTVTQYLQGRRVETVCPVSDDAAELADHMALSCEILRTGQLAVYGRYQEQDEDAEVLLLGIPDDPALVERVIRAVAAQQ